jgi:ribosomal protein L16/L10AE
VLYEIQGAAETTARIAMNRIAHKLPVRVRMVSRRPRV